MSLSPAFRNIATALCALSDAFVEAADQMDAEDRDRADMGGRPPGVEARVPNGQRRRACAGFRRVAIDSLACLDCGDPKDAHAFVFPGVFDALGYRIEDSAEDREACADADPPPASRPLDAPPLAPTCAACGDFEADHHTGEPRACFALACTCAGYRAPPVALPPPVAHVKTAEETASFFERRAALVVTLDAAAKPPRVRKPTAPWEPPGRVKITLAGLGIDAAKMLSEYREAFPDDAVVTRRREGHFKGWCVATHKRDETRAERAKEGAGS